MFENEPRPTFRRSPAGTLPDAGLFRHYAFCCSLSALRTFETASCHRGPAARRPADALQRRHWPIQNLRADERDRAPRRGPAPLHAYVSCVGPLGRAPEKPDLRKLPAFKKRFDIQDLPKLDLFGARPGEHAWEFHYVLRPRNPEVTEIPPLIFSYYKPGVIPARKGYWTTATPSMPLKVTPRSPAIMPTDPLRCRSVSTHITEGSAVLAPRMGWRSRRDSSSAC